MVGAAGSQDLAVGAVGEAGDEIGVPIEGMHFLTGVSFPDAHELVTAGGGDVLAIGAVDDGADRLRVGAIGAQLAAGGEVPDAHGVIVAKPLAAGPAAARRQLRAVGAEGQGVDEVGVPQLEVAEDASDMVGELRRRGGEVPACFAEGFARFEQAVCRQRHIALLGVLICPPGEFGRELLHQPVFLGVGAFGLELGLAPDVVEVERLGLVGGAARHRHQGCHCARS